MDSSHVTHNMLPLDNIPAKFNIRKLDDEIVYEEIKTLLDNFKEEKVETDM
jgi:hypothetical protein